MILEGPASLFSNPAAALISTGVYLPRKRWLCSVLVKDVLFLCSISCHTMLSYAHIERIFPFRSRLLCRTPSYMLLWETSPCAPTARCMQGGFVMGGSVIQLIGAVLRTPFHAAGCLLTLFAAAQILLELSDRNVRSRL